ncbi:hypothetical protein B0A48_14958 [Cryoendolithus antarcticus]|uniref:2EXR domain-containing protein n=1 Tax=Cryoendolithus antarcticus TaxID=1507870 RepID=A0A1V8SJ78_9PEZI|nr:hypothetical protein B0A48_14958 [Cryoendolithus antarcticus]
MQSREVLSELAAFVRARKLATGTTKAQARRLSLERLLLDDDAHPVFDRFLYLPAEIRQQIFFYYFDALRDRIVSIWEYSADLGDRDNTMFSSLYVRRSTVKLAKSPPLVYCNRQLRQEALPLCWSTCTFRAVLFADYNLKDHSSPKQIT